MNSDRTNRTGIGIAAVAFEVLNFAFREQPTSDHGIDAHIERRTAIGVTGEIIALQIKSGTSYFEEGVSEGWYLRPSQHHVQYWLQHSLPIVIVIVDVEKGHLFWEEVTEKTVQFTKKGAKILVPRNHQVDSTAEQALLRILSPVYEYGSPIVEGAGHRVFFSEGIPRRNGWLVFAQSLVQRLSKENCTSKWDILVAMRTETENDALSTSNEFGADGDDLAEIHLNNEQNLITYSVSRREARDLDIPLHRNSPEIKILVESILDYIYPDDSLCNCVEPANGLLNQ